MVDFEHLLLVAQVEDITGPERNTLMRCEFGSVAQECAVGGTEVCQQNAVLLGLYGTVAGADAGGSGGVNQIAVGIASDAQLVINGDTLALELSFHTY